MWTLPEIEEVNVPTWDPSLSLLEPNTNAPYMSVQPVVPGSFTNTLIALVSAVKAVLFAIIDASPFSVNRTSRTEPASVFLNALIYSLVPEEIVE